MVTEARLFNDGNANAAFRALPYSPRLAAELFAAGVELSAGLLPSEVEYQLAGLADDDLRSTIEHSLIENLPVEVAHAYFDRPCTDECAPLVPFDPMRGNWRGYVTTGKSSFEKGDMCGCGETDFPTIVRGAFGHKVSKNKDGFWFSPCHVEPVARANDNVRAIYGACVDVDDGTLPEQVIEQIAAAGLAVVIASSYSNMKTNTAVAESTVMESVAGGKSAADILISVKKYRPEVAEGATFGEIVKTKDRKGNPVEERLIHHRPCPRLRIFVPYRRPLREADFGSHRAFVAAHKDRYRAVAKMIGVENHDKQCENPARIFFTARHPEGKPHFSVELPGRFLDPNDPQLLALVPEDVKESRLSADGRSSGEPADIQSGDFNFLRWAACGFGDNFLIVDALEARHLDAFFDQSDGEWPSIYCPHDWHEQNGGTHVKNAEPSAAKAGRGFSIHCKHNTCAAEPLNNDRLAHLAKMVEAGWLSKTDLVSRDFFAGTDAEHARAMSRFFPQRLPAPFARTAQGICHVTPAEGDKNKPIFERVCDDFVIVAESKNELGEEHSAIIEFVSDDLWHRERIPMALIQGDPKRIRESLAGKGLRIDGSSRAKGFFDTLVSRLASDKRIMTVSRPGFHTWQNRSVFVAPNGQAIDVDGERNDVTLVDAGKIKNTASRGSFSDWFNAMEAVVKAGNPHWIVGACSGFCGPLVNLLEMDSTGIALIGETSTGKSLGQGMGAAVWGDPDPNKGHGVFRSARTTDNGIEARAALSHGSLLAVDDLAHADPRMVSKLVFLLAGGSGKERMNPDGSARVSKTWATFYTLSSERSISDLIKMGGENMLGGHAVRLPTINVTGARIVTPNELAAVEAYKTNYGHAWQPFIAKLFKLGFVAEPAKLRDRLDDLIEALCGSSARSTDRRAARPFALVWLGGEIARDAGALPMIVDVEPAVRWAWNSYRAGAEAEALSPMDRAINAMRANVQAAWDTDLPRLNSIDPIDPTDAVFNEDSSDVARRPFRPIRWGWYNDDTIFILRGKLVELAGMTDTPQAIAGALKARGYLIPNSDRLFHKHLPGRGKVEHFRLRRAEFLGVEEADD
jgi:hypothetical protein